MDSVPAFSQQLPISEIAATPSLDIQPATRQKRVKLKFNPQSVHLLIGMDYSYYSPLTLEKDQYSGPYYPVPDSLPDWTQRSSNRNLSKSYPVSNVQFNFQANFWKGLYIGVNYQFFSIKRYKNDLNTGNLLSKVNTMFFIVSANVGYVFEFLKNKSLQVHPSFRLGGYSADDYYDRGTGRKFYFGVDCRVRYLIKRKFGFSLGVDYDFLRYKRSQYNDIFQREAAQKTIFNNVHLNVGICYNITIRTQK
jgi:hypothetical protein